MANPGTRVVVFVFAAVVGLGTGCTSDRDDGGSDFSIPIAGPIDWSGPTASPASGDCDTPAVPFQTAPGVTLAIAAPADRGAVPAAFAVKARVIGNVPAGFQAWTLTQIVGPATHPSVRRDRCAATTRLWPGSEALRVRDGVLDGVASCGGGPNDAGLTCRLMIVAADARATGRLGAYNDNAVRLRHSGLGLADLVGVIRILGSVTVTRTSALGRSDDRCKPRVLPLSAAGGVTGSLVSPTNGGRISHGFPVTAMISSMPAGYQPWILVQITGPANHPTFTRGSCVAATRVWPSAKPLNAQQGRYAGATSCAGATAGDADVHCQVTLVLAAAAGSAQFRAYARDAAGLGYSGLATDELAGDIRSLAAVSVTRTAALLPDGSGPPRTTPPPPTGKAPASVEPCTTPPLPVPVLGVGATITMPANGSKVGQAFPVTADVPSVPAGYAVWTFLQIVGPASHPTYQGHACAASTRIWPNPLSRLEGATFDGFAFCASDSADAGIQCRLTIIIADPLAQAALNDYRATAPSRQYPGMGHGELPGGLKRVAEVYLVRT